MSRTGSTYVEIRSAYKIVVGKPEEKRLLWRRRRRWEVKVQGKVVPVLQVSITP
jgi:hypothetical protein